MKKRGSAIIWILVIIIIIGISLSIIFILKNPKINTSKTSKPVKDLFIPFKECINSCNMDNSGLGDNTCFNNCKGSLKDIGGNLDSIVYENIENYETFYAIGFCTNNCKKNLACTNECLDNNEEIDYNLYKEYHKKSKEFWDSIFECINICPINDKNERNTCSDKCFEIDTSDQFDFTDEEFEKIKNSGIYDIVDDYPFYINKCFYCTDYQGCSLDCYEKTPIGYPIKNI